MRYLSLLAAVGLILAVTVPAGALVTLVFDPNDILDRYPADSSGLKATQEDARRVHAQWGNPYYGTFSDIMQSGHSQSSDYNTYVNWRNGLNTSGEGIAVFNVWFINKAGAISWGETTVVKPGTTVTATAAAGWNYVIIPNPYGIGGDVVQWYTLDPASRLRPTDLGGADIGNFSVTADLYHDLTGDGWTVDDTPVSQDEAVRFWVGCLNGDDPGFYRADTQAIYFDDKWGDELPPNYGTFGATYSTAAGQGGSGFEGVLAVPEPVTMIGLLLSVGGVAGYIRRRRMA